MTVTRIIYLILLFIISWCGYYLYEQQQPDNVQVAPNLELPVFSGNHLVNTSFSLDGIRSHKIESDHLDHFAKSGETIFVKPILSVYRDGKTIEWQITADKAVLDKKQNLTLYDDVTVKNLLPDASFSTMLTDSMTIELRDSNFKTNSSVQLLGPQFKTVGQAMKGNFKENNATLFNQVQGKYEITTP